jgi:hypothetical protein
MSPIFDPDRILRTLTAREVDFVVIGGLAGNILGTADVTNDLDICYARERENLERLAGALQDLEARLRVAGGADDDLPFPIDARSLRLGDSFTFVTVAGDLDVLATPSGTSGYQDLAQDARRVEVGEGLDVLVVSLDDLIRMKRASARVKDRLQLEHLAALRDEIAEGGDPFA